MALKLPDKVFPFIKFTIEMLIYALVYKFYFWLYAVKGFEYAVLLMLLAILYALAQLKAGLRVHKTTK